MKEKLKEEELKALHGPAYVDHFNQNEPANRNRISGILKRVELSTADRVCDFGCGNGLLFEQIHKKVGAYTGVDFSKAFIQAFKDRLPHLHSSLVPELHQKNIIEFAQDHQDEFDKAFTLDFSEHLYDHDFVQIYGAIQKTLKTGGKLIFHTPNGGFFIEILKNYGILKQQDQHVGVRTKQENFKLLNQAGFSHFEVRYIPHYNILKHLHLLSFIPLIGSYFKARLLICCTK